MMSQPTRKKSSRFGSRRVKSSTAEQPTEARTTAPKKPKTIAVGVQLVISERGANATTANPATMIPLDHTSHRYGWARAANRNSTTDAATLPSNPKSGQKRFQR